MLDLKNITTICINLKTRTDKRQFMQKQAQRRGLSIKFYTAEPNTDPVRGCLESHLAVIEEQVAKGSNHILILEDDAKFIALPKVPDFPPNWDMLYLGGNVRNRLDNSADAQTKPWVRMRCWTTHAYIINLQNRELVADIMKARTIGKEIDNFYIEQIHGKYNCFMLNPMIAIQRDGYSDIEKRDVNYDFMTKTLFGFQKPEHEVTKEGYYKLKLPEIGEDDLPNVSIVTPTYNRKKMFQMAIYCFEEMNYPKSKIEWVIVDDTPPRFGTVEPLIKEMCKNNPDFRVNYVKMEMAEDGKPSSIARKRNIGVLRSSHDYIVHMDDDDYYPPESVLARIKLLLKYEKDGKRCVGCSTIGKYDIVTNKSTMASDGDLSMSEASMAYTKQFWLERPFVETDLVGEYAGFIADRFDQIVDMPYSFVIVAIAHYTNYTKDMEKEQRGNLVDANTGETSNFFDMWDEETQQFVSQLRKTLVS